MRGRNGSIIGVDNIPTVSAASGIWTLNEVRAHVDALRWPGTIVSIGSYDAAGDTAPGTSPSITLTSPGAGDYVVFMTANNGGGTFSSATLDTQTITIHSQFVANSSNVLAVGTCTGVGTGSITLAWTASASQLRAHGWIFNISGGDLSSPAQTPQNTTDHNLTWSTLSGGSAMFHLAASQSGTAFTGATDLTWTENLAVESASSCGFALSSDSNTTTDITGGSASSSGALGIEINPG